MLYNKLHWHTYSPQTLDIYNKHAKKLVKYPINHFIQSNNEYASKYKNKFKRSIKGWWRRTLVHGKNDYRVPKRDR